MLIVKLQRHHFIDDPTWTIVKESVPIGTEYEVIGYRVGSITRKSNDEKRQIDCYLIRGNGSIGWMPVDVFEVLDTESEKPK